MRLLYLNNSLPQNNRASRLFWRGGKRDRLLFSIVIAAGFFLLFINTFCLAIESKTFDGKIDFFNKNISLTLDLKEQGKLEVSGALDGDKYNLRLALRHIKFGKSDLLTDFYATGIIIKSEDGKLKTIKGKAWTQASLLNFKPLKEFSADYELRNSRLTINSLSWADFDLKGHIDTSARLNVDGERGRTINEGLVSNFNLNPLSGAYFDIALTIREMDLKDLAGLLGVNPEDVELSGEVWGQVKIKGPHNAVKIEAKLTALNGRVSMVRFNSAKINVEGLWPVLRFVDSQINDMGGVVYELKGKFNLKELSEFNSAEHQVTVYSANNAMRFEDWVIKRRPDEKGQDMVEAEYPLQKNQALKMRIKNQEETLGWEKRVKF